MLKRQLLYRLSYASNQAQLTIIYIVGAYDFNLTASDNQYCYTQRMYPGTLSPSNRTMADTQGLGQRLLARRLASRKPHRRLTITFLAIKMNDSILEGFPSGQRGQTVNLLAQPSKVRILPPPPPRQLLAMPGSRRRWVTRPREPAVRGGGGKAGVVQW